MAAVTSKSWILSVGQQELLIKSCFEGSPSGVPRLSNFLSEPQSAKEFSYTPYSRFRVGAALLTLDGRVVKGACIDNVAYGEHAPCPLVRTLRLLSPIELSRSVQNERHS